jgi:hypothetical protein
MRHDSTRRQTRTTRISYHGDCAPRSLASWLRCCQVSTKGMSIVPRPNVTFLWRDRHASHFLVCVSRFFPLGIPELAAMAVACLSACRRFEVGWQTVDLYSLSEVVIRTDRAAHAPHVDTEVVEMRRGEAVVSFQVRRAWPASWAETKVARIRQRRSALIWPLS